MFIKVNTKGTIRYVKTTDEDYLKLLKEAGGYEVEGDEEGRAKIYTVEEVTKILNPDGNRTSVESILEVKPKKSSKSTSKKGKEDK